MMRKLCLVLATSAIGVTGAAYAASFADIDSNADGTINAEEFAAAYPEVAEDAWTTADANGDGMLSEEEHIAAVADGLLSAE
ncbi:MAG TPA: EF-hand domain-containing protein [Thermohalobaculum sp.]|nr:EF-hand domain-containing protein [Thermohalobaculum sp.]